MVKIFSKVKQEKEDKQGKRKLTFEVVYFTTKLKNWISQCCGNLVDFFEQLQRRKRKSNISRWNFQHKSCDTWEHMRQIYISFLVTLLHHDARHFALNFSYRRHCCDMYLIVLYMFLKITFLTLQNNCL